MHLILPDAQGRLADYTMTGVSITAPARPRFNRVAFAAAHVVADPLAGEGALDWDATLAFRHHLWSCGFKIAEAMDTAQRGMGVAWPQARELITRSLAEARTVAGADLACGAGTDQIEGPASLVDVIRAYEEQAGHVEGEGGRVILMASRALAKAATSADDYTSVYGHILRQCRNKVVLHWLGPDFDPELRGYWGSDNFAPALETVLSIIADNRDKVEGIKISLLDEASEIALRDRLPEGVLCFTGDDFNYAPLIEGDGRRHSHALLGIFDAVAPVASAALTALAEGDTDRFRLLIGPTVPLSRKIFEAPTRFYKAGVVFLAWLNGHQSHFIMPGQMHAARDILHYAGVFRLADQAGLLANPDLAHQRMKALLALNGIG